MLHRLRRSFLKSRKTYRGQLSQRERPFNVTDGAGSKCSEIQGQRDLERGIGIVDLTEDESGHC